MYHKQHRILVTGSNGLIGQNLIKIFSLRTDIDLLAVSRNKNLYPSDWNYRFERLDLTVANDVNALVRDFKPTTIIHTAAMTHVDPCENDQKLCQLINVEATGRLADLAADLNAHFVFLSTDFVFSGERGPYSESDSPDPISVYGRSKLEAENLVQRLQIPWTIIRTILVYGVVPSMSRSNLVLWVKDALSRGESIKVVNDQFRMPTLVDDLAQGIVIACDRMATGIFHLSGPEMISIYDFAIKIARFFSLDESLISPVSSRTLNQPGVRPPATGFILDKAMKELNYHPSDLQQGLQRMQSLLGENT